MAMLKKNVRIEVKMECRDSKGNVEIQKKVINLQEIKKKKPVEIPLPEKPSIGAVPDKPKKKKQ